MVKREQRGRDAILVGLFQTLALIPGASRSGVTITAGLFAGLSRPAAARFSFLLSLPSILGAGLYDTYKDRQRDFSHQLRRSEPARQCCRRRSGRLLVDRLADWVPETLLDLRIHCVSAGARGRDLRDAGRGLDSLTNRLDHLRQPDRELGPVARLALHLDRAAVGLDDLRVVARPRPVPPGLVE